MFFLFSHWHVLWFVRASLMAILFCLVFKQRIHRDFPLFSAFIGWLAFCGIAMLWMDYAPAITEAQYNVGYEVDSIVDVSLAFAVLYELFRYRLDSYSDLSGAGLSTFRWATIGFIFIAIGLAWYIPIGHFRPLVPTQALILRTVRTLQCGLLLSICVFCEYFRLPWRGRSRGIAIGLGLYLSTSLALNALRTQLSPYKGVPLRSMMDFLNEVAYLITVLVWSVYFLRPEEAVQNLSPQLPEEDLRAWNQELSRISK